MRKRIFNVFLLKFEMNEVFLIFLIFVHLEHVGEDRLIYYGLYSERSNILT